jgi:hypothetical protein
LVSFPLFAIDKIPRLECLSEEWNSSLKYFCSKIDSPPAP